ncbi:hypothetical protein LUZ61_019507 [Rhynchospora tenuis]|uniref:KIB1-4 beta-propeller domain-containing protein n=1 Tax=Rhynchospora tenuis TaxID=198213 RepID=A0AAD5ZBA4_9POAL|nr:hypothetical protein LUZ61_019507 [Rhynchospora tenuis]
MEGAPLVFPEWAHLPGAAVLLISEKLKSVTDYVRFCAVCSPWRAASLPKPRHLPPQLPWVMIPWDCRDKEDDGIRLFYDLWESKMRKLHLPETSGMVCSSSDYGWILLVEAKGKEVFLLNPLTRARINLPPFATLRHLVIPNSCDNPRYDNCWHDPYMGFFWIRKVTFSADPTNPDCLITVFPWRCCGFFCCRVRDSCWAMIKTRPNPNSEEYGEYKSYSDAAYYNGRFYLLYNEAIEIIDSNNPEERIVHLLEPNLRACSKFLIEGKSGVYAVTESSLDEDDPADHCRKEHTVGCPRRKIELYKFQAQLVKLEKVTDTSSTIIFSGCHSCPYVIVCSDDWELLDGGSKYMVVMDLSLMDEVGGALPYNISITNLDDDKLKSVVSGIGKGPLARPMWFQPSPF